jgi:hypothetical protein
MLLASRVGVWSVGAEVWLVGWSVPRHFLKLKFCDLIDLTLVAFIGKKLWGQLVFSFKPTSTCAIREPFGRFQAVRRTIPYV